MPVLTTVGLYCRFLKDPSGNNLEFKSMKIPGNLYAKYDVQDVSK